MTEPSGTEGATALAPGARFGDYRILRLLGRGGMGAAYEAEVVEDGRRVALKVLAQDFDDDDLRRRFLREGQLAAALNHPHTVYIYGTGEAGRTLYIAMELVAGGTLEERVEQRGPLPIAETIEGALQIVDGLAAAHALGILHRDIKPSNLFVGLDGAVKVGDFGLSKSTAASHDTTLTQSGMFIGTPAFSAPEQMLGEALDLRTDIYSVGATLYYLLTAKHPFVAATSMQMMAAVMQGSPVSPRTHRAEIPDRLAAIVLRCLARRREDRYPDYETLRTDLEALHESAVPARLPARAAALVIDVSLAFVFGLLLLLIPGALDVLSEAGSRINFFGNVIALSCLLIVKGVPEALWGTSAGKALLDLRVLRVDGRPIGWARGMARNAVLCLPLVLDTTGIPSSGLVDALLLGGGALAILSTMRPRNGYSGLHDRLLGTRVVRQVHATSTRRLARPAGNDLPVPAGAERLGPFRVVGPLTTLVDGSRIDSAFDPTLRRAVWIHRHAVNHPPLAAERRELAREGRLRWVASRRTEDQNWDAYEAPDGYALISPGVEAVSWEVARGWLCDLAAELGAAGEAKESPVLALDRVWITSNGAMILEFPVTEAPGPVAVQEPGAFLAQVARRALSGPGGERASSWPVLPLRARTLLDELPETQDTASILARLTALHDAPGTLDRRKRGFAMALASGPAFALVLLATCISSFGARVDPEMARLQPILHYLDRAGARESDSTVAANRKAIGIFIASNHRERLSDPGAREGFWGGSIPWPLVDSALVRYRGASADEQSVARRMVEARWKLREPGQRGLQSPIINITMGLATLLVTALLSILAALLFRGGWAFRTAGIAIVSNSGRRAGRIRLVARAILASIPFVVALALLSEPRGD